jgi:uncharacterized phage-associated protein
MSALNVSKHLLGRTTREAFELSEGISNLKMQKLLYYCQKVFVSVEGEPFFDDTIQAWQHGPVIPAAYDRFKRYGRHDIDITKEDDFIKSKEPLDEQRLLVVDFVWDKYMRYSAWALRQMTHREPDYINNYMDGVFDLQIPAHEMPDSSLADEFKSYRSLMDELGQKGFMGEL